MVNAQGRQRVHHGVGDRWGRAVAAGLADTLDAEPEFEEPRHTSASSRRQNKENQGELRLFCHQT